MRITRVLRAVLALAPAAAAPLYAWQALSPARVADSVQRLVEQARIAGDSAGFTGARVLLERGLAAYPDDALLLHYQGWALYVEASAARGGRSSRDLNALLEDAQRILERSAALRPIPETWALLSSVLGQRIGSSPIRGMTLGPRSGRAMARAHSLGPANPRVWLLDGIGAIFTPGMFGGGLDKAEQRLVRALELFEQDRPEPPLPAWGRAEAHIWLGQVYQRTRRPDLARTEYQRALTLEPDNGWVRFALLPALDSAARR